MKDNSVWSHYGMWYGNATYNYLCGCTGISKVTVFGVGDMELEGSDEIIQNNTPWAIGSNAGNKVVR